MARSKTAIATSSDEPGKQHLVVDHLDCLVDVRGVYRVFVGVGISSANASVTVATDWEATLAPQRGINGSI